MASKTFLGFYKEWIKAYTEEHGTADVDPASLRTFFEKAEKAGHQNSKLLAPYLVGKEDEHFTDREVLQKAVEHFDTDVVHHVDPDNTQPSSPWPILNVLLEITLKDGSKFKGSVRSVGNEYHVFNHETHTAKNISNLKTYKYVPQ